MAAALAQPPVAVALASIQPLPAALVLTGFRPPVNAALMHYIGLHKHYAKLPTESATSRLTALLSPVDSTAIQSDSLSAELG